MFNYSAGKLKTYDQLNFELFAGNSDNLIETFYIDSSNRIWIGTKDHLITGNIIPGGQIKVQEKLPFRGISVIKEDRDGNMWIGTVNALFKVNKGETLHSLKEIYTAHVPDICVLSSGEIMFSSYEKGIFIMKNDSIKKVSFFPDEAGVSDILPQCITLFEDSKKRIWIGSYGKGLLCLDNNETYLLNHTYGLPSNDVLCFQEDAKGNIWISTSFGLSRIDPDHRITNFFSSDGTLGDQFHEKAGMLHADGRIFFGGNHGLTFFYPLGIGANDYSPPVHLEDLKVMNRSIQPAPKGSLLQKSIAFADHITLNHKHSVVSLDYSGIDFLAPQKLTYAYKLEGFDKDWNHVGIYRRATYSNLAPGSYTFMVKAINGDGIESVSPAVLSLTVKPAPWFSWPAWIIYFIILFAGIFLLVRLWLRIKLSKQQLIIEQHEREREKEIAEMKMTFFTNISHELRTPLTLISAPLEQLLSFDNLNQPMQKLLHVISRNVQRLLLLMNQLLDFRKMEEGMLSLKVARVDLIACIRSIMKTFDFYAQEKQISLRLYADNDQLEMYIDIDKLEKIMHNLLSNAIKYTPHGGSIRIHVCLLTIEETYALYLLQKVDAFDYIEISVSDTGPGVPADKINELFHRYKQLHTTGQPDYAGTGIGLHFTKKLVETHKGKILAKVEETGGMKFSFILPLNPDIYTEEEKIIYPSGFNFTHEETNDENNVIQNRTHKYTILLAEDNIDLMSFLHNLLNEDYNLIQAIDGDEAWILVQKEMPDMVVSDVLMPGINGYRLCANIKQTPELSHIPVMLLTAKSSEHDKIEGLEQGADLYICKPFNVDYLLLSIRNLFKGREVLRTFYSSPQSRNDETLSVKLSYHDQVFMDNLTGLLKKELSNTDMNIDSIARELGYSRTNFYRKLKGLTDMSPVDFIRSYRLRCAAEMIQDGKYHLNEIAEKAGFGTYSYFSMSFKKQFGVAPKDYK